MRTSEIKLLIDLDNDNIPEKLRWNATDKGGPEETTKAFSLAIWDSDDSSIMKIDLWTKDMLVGEMKRFFIQMMGSMAETMMNSTGDEKMVEEIQACTERLSILLEAEEKAQGTS